MRSRLSRTAASGRPTVVKWSSFELDARDIDFDIDQVGVDAINRGGKGFEEHRDAKERTIIPITSFTPALCHGSRSLVTIRETRAASGLASKGSAIPLRAKCAR